MELFPTATVFIILCAIVITTTAAPITEKDVVESIGEYGELVEGDMVLTKEQQDAIYNTGVNTRNGMLNTTKRWENNTVTYEIMGFDATDTKIITNALAEIEKNSCVKFRPKQTSSEHAVIIQSWYIGCFSTVGRSDNGAWQGLNLDYGCVRHGIVIHEMLHTLGFYHMQSTYNRDDYVTIMWDNIKETHKHNFIKYNSETVSNFGVSYDYGSVMHYPKTAFTLNGKDTIVPKQKDVTIGQRDGLSKGDILKLNRMYKCPETSNS